MPLFFSNLVSSTDEGRREFETNAVVMAAVANGMSVDRYRRLLLELYHVVLHFNPVCAAAASRMDGAHQAVQKYLYQHMLDESGHEQWVLNDLEAIGVHRESAVARQPLPFTLAMTGYNYWSAERRHPCSALGMVYALEVIASVYGGPFAAAMRESLLLSGDAGVTFIASHATMDAEHMAHLKIALDSVEDPVAQGAIEESALLNFHHFTRLFESI